jgi:hypothetical protein
MGTDIHLYVESLPDGVIHWQRELPPAYWADNDRYCQEQLLKLDGHPPEIGSHEEWAIERPKYDWYDNRNYSVFAMLANVRNWDDSQIVPIAMPRGYPDDMSEEVAQLTRNLPGTPTPVGEITPGYHDFSWLGLDELTNPSYWNRTVRVDGTVNTQQFKRYQHFGKPDMWAANVFGVEATELSVAEMAVHAARGPIDPSSMDVYCHLEWDETYREMAGFFCATFVPALNQIAQARCSGDQTRVRIIIGFDS